MFTKYHIIVLYKNDVIGHLRTLKPCVLDVDFYIIILPGYSKIDFMKEKLVEEYCLESSLTTVELKH